MAAMITERLRRRRTLALASAALAGSALAVAGCGGSSESGSTAGDVASYVPSTAPLYLEVSTDFGGAQWKQVEELAKLFPSYPKLRTMLDQSLRSGAVDFTTEVKPLLGGRAALAGLNVPSSADVTGSLTAPPAQRAAGAARAAKDMQVVAVVDIATGKQDAVKALLVKNGDTLQGEHDGVQYYGTPSGSTVVAVDTEAMVISDAKERVFAALDAHKAGGDRTLAGTSKFTGAIGKLPADVFGQAYLDVGAFVQAAGTATPRLGQVGLSEYQNAVMASSIAAEPGGVRVKGVVVGAPDAGATEFSPTLTKNVPADAIAYVGFDDLAKTVSTAFKQIQNGLPSNERTQADALTGQLPAMLGVSLGDIGALASGEHALVVTSGRREPGVALALQVQDGARATATLDKLRTGLPGVLRSVSPGGTRLPAWQRVPLAGGVQGWRLPLSPTAGAVYGVDGNLVVVGSTVPAVVSVQRSLTPLANSAAYQQATNGMPDKVTSVVWLNLRQGVDALRNAGALKGATPETIANLRPLKSIAAWTTAGSTPTFEVLLSISK